jgi:hypothetical protein
MDNIRFQYLYRDAGNYKKRGTVIFSNPEGLDVQAIANCLLDAFLPGLFIARQIRIPEVFLTQEYPLSSDDHRFHEFCSIESTPEPPSDEPGRSAEEFVIEVVREAERGWLTYNPQLIEPSIS